SQSFNKITWDRKGRALVAGRRYTRPDRDTGAGVGWGIGGASGKWGGGREVDG
ncbi:hypothetical protein HKBW3S34_02069, partial [Candidatus Hakubella thermalkaliphila]